MAQRAFMADGGVRLGEWTIIPTSNGSLQVSNMHTVTGTQKLFRVDTGLRMGDWRMTLDGNGDMLLSETALTGPQRPFIADGGVKIGTWTLYPTEDGDLYAKKDYNIPSYAIAYSSEDVDEGSQVTFTLSTTDVANGTTLYYTISGVESADIGGASLTGSFIVGTTESVTFTLTEDSAEEGAELIFLGLNNGEAISYVTVNDTSNPGTIDLSQYTYTVALTDSNGNAVTSVDEGSEYTITTTTDAPDGTYLWVHLTSNNELGNNEVFWIDWLMDNTQSLARKPMVSGGGTTTSLSIVADNTTEINYEKFTVKISIADEWADVPDNYVTETAEITINDTSQDPISAVYTVTPNDTSVDEGSTAGFTATTNQGEAVLYWNVVGGSSDINGDSGSFAVNTATGTGTFNTGTVTADQTTEGSETFTVEIRTGSNTGPVVATSSAVTINDTSVEAQGASSYNWNITTTIDHPTNLSSIATNNYDDANYQAQLAEGDTMSWTATTNAPDGTTVYFTCVSTYYGSYDSAGDPSWNDISGNPGTSGTLTVLNGQVSGTITAISDNTAEDGELRQVWLMPQAGDYSNILGKSQWFHIADPSGASGVTAPAVGTWMYGGEAIAPGWWETEWNGSNTLTVKFDTSSTSTAGWGTTNDQWEYVLDDWAAGNGTGDTIEIRGDGGLRVLTINGSVTKTQIGSSDTYYYAIPVSVTTGTMGGAGYLVTPLYLQHQYNG